MKHGQCENCVKRAAEVEWLRKGIQDYLDGNYANPRQGRTISPQHKCFHGAFYWESCENCIDEHFTRILAWPVTPASKSDVGEQR